jgi:hypothetical protein
MGRGCLAERSVEPDRGTLIDAALPRWRDLGPWVAVVTGPLAALLQLTLGLVLAPTARDLGGKALLYAISALMLAATAVAALACERHRRRAALLAAERRVEQANRVRFVGLGGLLLNAFSLLVLIAQTLPIFILRLDD